MESLLSDIRACKVCSEHLTLGPRPIIAANVDAKIAIIGQAPGTRVHLSGTPWDDASGRQLRKWLGITDEVFYDETKIALIPMGFCYPGKGKTGDLPPRTECAPLWHEQLFEHMPNIQLIILIGMYAQKYYLKDRIKKNLTETVKVGKEYLPTYFPTPHPSPRNRFWFTKNPWFQEEMIPKLQEIIQETLL